MRAQTSAIGRLGAMLFAASVAAGSASAATFYLSPGGNDAAAGTSEATPWRSFATAFSRMTAGDELVLLDGVYSEAAGTGRIDYLGAGSAQVPSGVSASQPTRVRALRPGSVVIEGPLFVGRSFRKDRFIEIVGITFDGAGNPEGGGSLYNTSDVVVRECGFHGSFGIGTNDHAMGNDRDLVEDVWIWASGARIIAFNYRSRYNVWRRVIIRGDGCGLAACAGGGNPNVGITVYDSADVTLENVMVLDRVLAPTDSPYSDFAVAQHTPGVPYGNNRWLGTVSIGAPDTAYYFEPDETSASPAHQLIDCIAWSAADGGINLARTGTSIVDRCTIGTLNGDGIRVAPELGGTGTIVRNVIVAGSGRYGINSSTTPSYVDVFGTWTSAYNQTACSVGCLTSNPRADGTPASLTYLPRIEAGSVLRGAGLNGSDIGANVVFRYGVDGTRYGDVGYDTLTGVPLWPWPHEARIRAQMCTATTRGFCGAPSITEYIWGLLGGQPPILPDAAPAADASTADAATIMPDAGVMPPRGPGCACSIGGRRGASAGLRFLAMCLVTGSWLRRRPARSSA